MSSRTLDCSFSALAKRVGPSTLASSKLRNAATYSVMELTACVCGLSNAAKPAANKATPAIASPIGPPVSASKPAPNLANPPAAATATPLLATVAAARRVCAAILAVDATPTATAPASAAMLCLKIAAVCTASACAAANSIGIAAS